MKKILILCVCLCACTPQKPAQTVINYTDNSQIVQVVGDNNCLDNTSDVDTEQTTTPTQTTENTTKNGMWVVWLVLIGLCLAGGAYLYYRKKKVL